MTRIFSQAYASELDAHDDLAGFRQEFHIPRMEGCEQLYLCGNSLGLQPKSTQAAIQQELDDWAALGVEGHFHAKHPWMPYQGELRELLAENEIKPAGFAVVGLCGLAFCGFWSR